jgi:hypothetical protein
VGPLPAEAAILGARPQVRTRSTVQALLWAIYGRLERVSLAEVRDEAKDEPAALWSVIRAIHRALDNIIAQLPAPAEDPLAVSAQPSTAANGGQQSTANDQP